MAVPLSDSPTTEEILDHGFDALVERLGYAGALRFLMSVRNGHGRFDAVRHKIFGDMTVDEIHDDAAAFERDHPEFLEGKQVH